MQSTGANATEMIKPPIPENETERLKALYELEILDTKEERVFDGLTSLAAYICKTPMALISLVDANRQWFKSRYNLSETETSRDVSFCAHAIVHNGTFTVADATKDERFADNPFVTADNGVRFYAGSPVVTPDGYKVGTLCVVDQVARELSVGQLAALRELSFQVSSHLELRQKIKILTRTAATKQ
ncbi:MAG TPA: GAF domain-containing protein [Pyrinomonadaceae bacterium]|nr:GAF domain-containing protein [Pyrinomonadaceae bacterium]